MTNNASPSATPRWQQRFQNYKRAYDYLQSAIDIGVENMSDLEKAGTIQNFEMTLELAWKTMKDFLIYSNVTIEIPTPKNIVKDAFSYNIIKDGHTWINMLEARNQLAHAYDADAFKETLQQIEENFIFSLADLKKFFDNKSLS